MNTLKKAKLALLVGLLTGGTAAYAQGDEMSQNRSDRGAYNPTEESYSASDAQDWAEDQRDSAQESASDAGDWAEEQRNAASEEWNEQESDLQANVEEQRQEWSEDRQQLSSAGQGQGDQHTVHFEFDSAELTDDARQKLEQMVEQFEGQDGALSLTVTGHTDAMGPEEYNQHLAEQRAKAVREFLEESDLEISNIEIEAAGENQLINEGDAISDRQENRRVEISVDSQSEELSAITE